MKVTTKELSPKKAVLHVEDTGAYFVNSLRRVMLSELPKLAINSVIIYDNTSPLFDEIISHRLSLIPIPTDLSVLTFRDQCTCKGSGCPNCTVRYTLSKEGEGVVYSGDLQPEEKTWAITEDLIPIAHLSKDQRIILEVEAILGQGRIHAKWQAVQAPAFKTYPIVDIDHKKCTACNQCVENCPKHILEIKNNKLVVTDVEQCTTCKTCVEKCESDAITVRSDNRRFLFHFETDGSLSSQEVLQQSAAILQKKYQDLLSLLKKQK